MTEINIQKQTTNLPYNNPTLPIEDRVNDLVSRLTLAEKISQMMNNAPAIERLGIPKYNWWSEALHGVARAGVATVFPQAIGLAATWNTALMSRVATAIADEARAKHHEAVRQGIRETYTGLTFWSPNINIFRDPRWGRGQETYGEDPYLTGRMAVAFVQGLQGNDPNYLKVVATAKHFAVHSGPEPERHRFNAQVDARDLRETYLPAFETCVREAKVFSVMGAYNRTNGEPCCASPTLLAQILRQEWGFAGYVVSDCDAIADIYRDHKVVATPAEAAAIAVKAGCDLNCGGTYAALGDAIAQGLIDEATIDQAVKRLFTARFRLGMFDPPERVAYAQVPYAVNDAPEHQDLALQVARQSIVLLKNANNFLPLPGDLKTIAVIGPNAADIELLWGNYNGVPSKPSSLLDGIRARLSPGTELLYAQGSHIINEGREGYVEAIALAGRADVVIFIGGISQLIEGEEGQVEGVGGGLRSKGDRTGLNLPAVQEELLKALHATGRPIVLVLVNGSALAVNWANDNLPAILEAWYPGQAGGTALAEVLFGDYNPGGRLPVTFYKSVGDLPPFEDYRVAAAGRTYRYFRGQPLYPFGHGLSYTTFSYSNLQLSAEMIGRDQSLTVNATVQNTGQRAGDEVVQLYLTPMAISTQVPIRQLRGFERVSLAPGEVRTLSFTLTPGQIALINQAGQPVVEPGHYQLTVGGRQPRPQDFVGPGNAILVGMFEVV